MRVAMLVVCFAMSVTSTGGAHPIQPQNGYVDRFDSVGPLPSGPADPWEVVTGGWEVVEQAVVTGVPSAGKSKVLVQTSRATTPNDPMAFVRARAFRSLTVQVTAAMLDDVTNASVGIVFRAPIDEETGRADKENLYLFTASNTGILGPFTTGHAFILFKRVGRGYYMQTQQIVNTYTDLTKPHDYKVVMSGGHIQAYVDGRRVISHTDVPSGDEPTKVDPFPGLPFDSGAVGLRTSGTRAWFDDFTVVGNDAYEARAAVQDGYVSQVENTALRRGVTASISNTARAGDTGFVYHDHDFDEAVIRPFENPGGSPAFGTSMRTFAKGGTVTSEVRMNGVYTTFTDITQRTSVTLTVNSGEIKAVAACDAAGSHAVFYDASFVATVQDAGGTTHTIGPIPIRGQLPPNTVVFEHPGTFAIRANVINATTHPRRVEATLLRVEFPDAPLTFGPFGVNLPVSIPGAGSSIGLGQTTAGRAPTVDYTLGLVTAGRYCS